MASNTASSCCSNRGTARNHVDIISEIMLVTLGLALIVAFIRLVKGPTLPDRIVAMDLFGVQVVGLIVVLAGPSGVRATLHAAIVIALVGSRDDCLRDLCRTRRSAMTDIVTAVVWLAGLAFGLLQPWGFCVCRTCLRECRPRPRRPRSVWVAC